MMFNILIYHVQVHVGPVQNCFDYSFYVLTLVKYLYYGYCYISLRLPVLCNEQTILSTSDLYLKDTLAYVNQIVTKIRHIV